MSQCTMVSQLFKATELIREIYDRMGGDNPSLGWSSPEDVWELSREALHLLSGKCSVAVGADGNDESAELETCDNPLPCSEHV